MTRRPSTVAVLAAALVVVLTGCGTRTNEGGDPASTTTEAPSPTPSDAGGDTATVEEWASLIAVEKDRVDEATQGWEDAVCSSAVVDAGAPDCSALMTSMSFVADTTAIIVTGAGDSTSPTYLGVVPDELTDLVAETRATADAASTAGQEAIGGCPGEDCVGVAFRFSMAFEDLRTSLVAWAPYL